MSLGSSPPRSWSSNGERDSQPSSSCIGLVKRPKEDGEAGLCRPACGRGIREAVLSRSRLHRDQNRSRKGVM